MEQDNLSHDNLFDSMLGMLDVKTAIYRKENDIFSRCHLNTGDSIAMTQKQNEKDAQ